MKEENIIKIPEPFIPTSDEEEEENISYCNTFLDSDSEYCRNTTSWD